MNDFLQHCILSFESTEVKEKADTRNFSAEVEIPADAPCFPGHFPGNPILPGICHITLLRLLAKQILGTKNDLDSIRKIRFSKPIPPNQRFQIHGTFERKGNACRMDAHFVVDGEKASVLTLTLNLIEDGQ